MNSGSPIVTTTAAATTTTITASNHSDIECMPGGGEPREPVERRPPPDG